MKEKNIKGLDNYFYYEEQLDTTFVLTSIETSEEFGNGVFYVFTPVYGPYESQYFLPVAYFDSLNKVMQDYRLFRLNDVHDVVYNFEEKDM